MSDYSEDVQARIVAALSAHRDPDRAPGMSRYMRDQYAFLGISTGERRALHREAFAELPGPTETDLVALSRALYVLPEREYQYVAVDHLVRHVGVCGPGFLEVARELITTKPWWDTVDGLAAQVVGPLVMAHPALAAQMDRWIEDDNTWLARTAILHQLKYKGRTDAGRLFACCEQRAGDTDFFIRKAIGWALREYSKTNPAAVEGLSRKTIRSLAGFRSGKGCSGSPEGNRRQQGTLSAGPERGRGPRGFLPRSAGSA